MEDVNQLFINADRIKHIISGNSVGNNIKNAMKNVLRTCCKVGVLKYITLILKAIL